MPELATERTPITNKAVRSTAEEQKPLLAQEGKEWLGTGGESLVFVDPRNHHKVISLSRPNKELTPEDAKKIFYVHGTRLENFIPYMEAHHYPQAEISKVISNIRRLKELHKQPASSKSPKT